MYIKLSLLEHNFCALAFLFIVEKIKFLYTHIEVISNFSPHVKGCTDYNFKRVERAGVSTLWWCEPDNVIKQY